MAIGLVGRKMGMTRIFTDEGTSIPVTVIEATPNRVSQIKSAEKDGYGAVQVATGRRRPSRITKPLKGHFAKAGVEPGRRLKEFRFEGEEGANINIAGELTVTLFKAGQKVDVTGITRGRGFAGVVRRYRFGGGDASHGNSLSHRSPGSIGQCQTPGRVFKGKKMAGQMGNVQRTVQSLELVRIDEEHHLLLVRGAIPGAPGGDVIVKPATKVKAKISG